MYYSESKLVSETNSAYNKYAYPVQLEFLGHRFRNEINSDKLKEQTLVLDRCLFEDFHIFAKTVHSLGYMNEEEFLQYSVIYNEKACKVEKPTIFVYLKTPTQVLLERIQKRGRSYELSIPPEYLDRLGRFYDIFFDNFSDHFPESMFISCETTFLDANSVFENVAKQIEDRLGLNLKVL
jgi:deoxyadenosine/deoxycytidine kinase